MNPNQLAAMLQLQYNMNAKVNPDWVHAGNDWCRAIVVEGGEALEHYGWKWWKRQVMDRDQYAIELIDIWHFALSHMIVGERGNLDDAATSIAMNLNNDYQREGLVFDGAFYPFKTMSTLERLELMIGLAVARRFSFPLFATLMTDIGMDWDELYRKYVGKNVLNFFRQDHGYKDGTYRKVWDDREDNAHMADILAQLNPAVANLPDELYARLAQRYAVWNATA